MAINSAELAHFSADYFEARRRFVDRARAAQFRHSQHTLAAHGPRGQSLTIDVAVRQPPQPTATVIVSSGLHGVEGFLGSAIQHAWLVQHETSWKPTRTRLVFVHALNPYGFARLRRCNEDNVDLNRNFLEPPDEYRGSPDGYARFDRLLNPRSPPPRWELFRLQAMWAILLYGLPLLKQTIAAGQYDFPQGLFYGGNGPCESTRYIRRALDEWIADSQRIVHLDFHTGLGRFGDLQLLLDAPVEATRRRDLEQHLERPLVGNADEASVAYTARGSIGTELTSRLQDRDYTYVCAEFGTYSPVTVLKALRAENRAHHWGTPDSDAARRAKRALQEAFCPISPEWRQRTLAAGRKLISDALRDADAIASAGQQP